MLGTNTTIVSVKSVMQEPITEDNVSRADMIEDLETVKAQYNLSGTIVHNLDGSIDYALRGRRASVSGTWAPNE